MFSTLAKRALNGCRKPVFASTSRNASSLTYNDPLNLRSQLTEEETMIWDTAIKFCDDELLPGIVEANRHEKFDRNIMKKFGEMGFLGPTLSS